MSAKFELIWPKIGSLIRKTNVTYILDHPVHTTTISQLLDTFSSLFAKCKMRANFCLQPLVSQVMMGDIEIPGIGNDCELLHVVRIVSVTSPENHFDPQILLNDNGTIWIQEPGYETSTIILALQC